MMQNKPNSNRSLCDELNDLLPAYAVGATTPKESARVRTLLAQCPEQAADLATYVDLSSILLEDVEPVEPPATLRDRVLTNISIAKVAESSTEHTTDPTPNVLQMPPSRANWAWTVAAAVSALLILTNVYWITTLNDTQAKLLDLENQQNTVYNLISNRGTIQVVVRSTSDEASIATVLYDRQTARGTLVTDTLPQLASTKTYQLWLIGSDTVVSAGIFEIDANGRGQLTFDPNTNLQEFDLIGISVEPAGGSVAPTTDPIGIGEISVS